MISYSNSTVFNVNADALVNTINCVGFMGKGLALEFSYRYPDLLYDYKDKCNKKEIQIGKIYYYNTKEVLIVNIPTKQDYKYPSKLEWIEAALINFIDTYKKYNIKKIAFPLLGTDNGKLNKQLVENIMLKYLSNLDIEVVICYGKNRLEGKDLEMLNAFKNIDINLLSQQLSLNNKQKDILILNQKLIKHFSDLKTLNNIGSKTYNILFSYFYNNKYKNKKENEQISLF